MSRSHLSSSEQPLQPKAERRRCVTCLVVGSGISGLFTALKCAEQGLDVLLITKSLVSENNSRYAQGGIAAVLPENTEDSLKLHVEDTLKAGAGLCDSEAVESILKDGHLAVADLLLYGVPFDRDITGGLALTKEAAHSVRRILHAGGDATGRSVEMTLIDKVMAHPKIEVMEYSTVVDLLVEQGVCYGAIAVDLPEKAVLIGDDGESLATWVVEARHTILATGGIGRLYHHTTNPTIATGDGMALAHRAGVALEAMEFVQFHPTAFFQNGKVQFLISEALRGEGGILRNHKGECFAKRYHPDGELAPRDVVTRAIFSELKPTPENPQGYDCVYLDISHLPDEKIEYRFPNILQGCLSFGVDIRKDPIPVAPAAHYVMGGFAVDLDGTTSVQGLYGVGETVHTGLHGANRLASNSLLECVVLARRVSEVIGETEQNKLIQKPGPDLDSIAPVLSQDFYIRQDQELQDAIDGLHRLMWNQVGVVRHVSGLLDAQADLHRRTEEAETRGWFGWIPHGLEYRNQLSVAQTIVSSALNRTYSLGAHYLAPETENMSVHSSV